MLTFFSPVHKIMIQMLPPAVEFSSNPIIFLKINIADAPCQMSPKQDFV